MVGLVTAKKPHLLCLSVCRKLILHWKEAVTFNVVLLLPFLVWPLQSAETLYVEGANYPSTVEVTSKGHAMEAVEVRNIIVPSLFSSISFRWCQVSGPE